MFHFYDNILLTYTVHVQVYDVNCAMIRTCHDDHVLIHVCRYVCVHNVVIENN